MLSVLLRALPSPTQKHSPPLVNVIGVAAAVAGRIMERHLILLIQPPTLPLRPLLFQSTMLALPLAMLPLQLTLMASSSSPIAVLVPHTAMLS